MERFAQFRTIFRRLSDQGWAHVSGRRAGPAQYSPQRAYLTTNRHDRQQTRSFLTSTPPKKVLIFGGGNIGAIFCYLLSRAIPQSDIVLVCRSNYAAIARNGLRINSALWGHNIWVRPRVARSAEEAVEVAGGSFDSVLVTTKALPSSPAAELIRPAISPATSIIIIQNGVRVERPFAALYPNNPIVSGVTYIAGTQTSPGEFEHVASDVLHSGAYTAAAPASHHSAAKAFADLMSSVGISSQHQQDVQIERWTKLLINASENPICALTRVKDTQLCYSSEPASNLMRQAMQEISAVAMADGYLSINEALVERQMAYIKARVFPGVEPSMMADANAGREMEVDAILGNVIAIGREKGINTPLLFTIYTLLSSLNYSFSLSHAAERSQRIVNQAQPWSDSMRNFGMMGGAPQHGEGARMAASHA